MKKYLLLLLCIATLMSCKKESIEPTNKPFVGKRPMAFKKDPRADSIFVNPFIIPTTKYFPPSGSETHGTYLMTIPFLVTASKDSAFIPASTRNVTHGTINNPTASAGPFIQYAVDDGSSFLANATADIIHSGIGTITFTRNGNFKIPIGKTESFTLVVLCSSPGIGSCRAQLVNVNWNHTDSRIAYVPFIVSLNTHLFQSPYVVGQ